MKKFRTRLLALVASAGFALLGLAGDSHAALVLRLTSVVTNGSGTILGTQDQTVIGTNNFVELATGSATVGGLLITTADHFGDNTQPVGTNIGKLLQSTANRIQNTTASVRNATLVVTIQNFTGPVNSVTTNGNIGFVNAFGTGGPASPSTFSLALYNDAANAQSFVNTSTGAVTVAGNQMGTTFSASPTNNTTQAYADQQGPFNISETGPFSMSAVFSFHFTGNAIFQNRLGSELKLNAVPEPGTVAMAFTALPLLGLTCWRKRRKQS